MADTFAALQSAAHAGAFGAGSLATPTPEQIRAGNYAKGSTRLHGMPIKIETPMFQPRRGKSDGAPWSVLCMAHYGYINGTVGADGDAVDIFVGPMPESLLVFVVNQQNKDQSFDEHKVMLGFADEQSARDAYMNSYEKGWTGLASLTPCTIKQFKYWLRHGDLSRPLVPGDLINDETLSMTDVYARWDDQRMPVGATVTDLITDLRRADNGLMMDAANMADLVEYLSDGSMLDAMVIEVAQFERKANQLLRVMQMAATGVKASSVEVSKAFKNRGTTQLAMLFLMDDGQSVSVFFHNPDTTPNKLTPTDEMVSWKWVLNKKDVTITVAPENGQDLNPREVARRIMKLVEKNSAKFTLANASKGERDAQIETWKAAEAAKTTELADLDKQIDDLTAKLEAKKAAPAPTADTPEPEIEWQPLPEGEQAAQDILEARQIQLNALSRPRTPVAPAPAAKMEAASSAPKINTFFSAASYKGYASGRDKLGMVNGWGLFKAYLDLGDGTYSLATTYNNVGMFKTEDEARSWAKSNKANAKGHFVVPALPAGSTILEDYADVAALGVAKVLAVGSENVYFIKDGKEYMTKLLNADDYDGMTGQEVDLSGVVDPSAAPAPDDSSVVLQGPAGPVTVAKTKYVETGEWAVSWASTHLATAPSKADGVAIAERVIASGAENIDGMRAALVEPAPEPASEPVVAAVDPNEDTGTIEAEGRDNTVKTAKGTKVLTGFKVIEARNLVISHETDGIINPDYPAEIQPRDRARATSQAWVQKTARNLDPDSLGRTQRADSGAPIVGPDRVVESGNGRAMAVREAYRIGAADEYREWLVENAEYFGVDVAKINRMKAPVLVRVRKSAVDRVEFAVEANQDDKLAMTATEKARSDAKRLDSAMLAKLADGDLNSAANRDFVAAFLQSLGDAEAAQYLTSDGKPTSSLISRLQAALFAGAYSDDRLLEMTADVAKPEIANIVSALNSAAPDFMRAKEQDRVGAENAGGMVTDSVELSLNQEAVNAIIGATNVLRQAKDAGMGLDEFLRQGDMFGGTDPAVAAMAVFIHANNRSAKRMSTAFKAMAQFVESENTRKQTASLFGDEPVSFTDIVGAANRKLEQEYGEGLFAIEQTDMFAQPPAEPAPPPEPIPDPVPEPEVSNNQDDALQAAKAYLDSLIDGSAALGDPNAVLTELERIYALFGEGELSGLFADAADAYTQYALKATAGAL